MKEKAIIIEKLILFKNNALCRDDTSQNEARRIWFELKELLTDKEVFLINDEWTNHLTQSYITIDQFSDIIESTIKKYKKS
jgi:ATP:corrinoid adenosyltransferase